MTASRAKQILSGVPDDAEVELILVDADPDAHEKRLRDEGMIDENGAWTEAAVRYHSTQ